MEVSKIDATTFARIIEHLAKKFNVPPDETARDALKHGMPILEEDCTVVVRNPQRWL